MVSKGNLNMVKHFDYDTLDGTYLKFYDNCKLKHINNYDNGDLHGWSIDWYRNGIMEYKGKWKRNKRVGEHMCWNKDGSLYNIGFNDKKRRRNLEIEDENEDENLQIPSLEPIDEYEDEDENLELTREYDGNVRKRRKL